MQKAKQFLKNNKKKIIWLVIFLIFLFILLIFFTYVIYAKSPFLNKIRSFFYFPIAIVGDSWITFKEFDDRVLVMENNFKNQDFSKFGIRIDFETDDGKKRLEIEKKNVLNDIIEQEIIKDLANKYEIKVTDEMVDMEVKRLITESGDSTGKIEEIKKIWGLDLDGFEDMIARPAEVRNAVDDYLGKETITDEMKNKIAQAKKELDDGRLFSDVVKKYSEGITKDLGGALGWFKIGQMNDEVNKVAFSLDLNKYSDIIESRQGFHIIMVTDKKELSNGEKMVYLNQIIVKKPSLAKIVEDKMKNTNILVLDKEYFWSKDCQKISKDNVMYKSVCSDSENDCESCQFKVKFTDGDMRKFEEKVYEEQKKLQGVYVDE